MRNQYKLFFAWLYTCSFDYVSKYYKLKSGEVLEFNFKDSRISKFEFTYKNLRDYDYKDNKVIKKTFRELLLKSIELRQLGDYKINYAMSGGLIQHL